MAAVSLDIPAAELEVLRALWRLGSGTVRDVQNDLRRQGRRLAYTTVLTLLGRLERRRCVSRARSDGLAHVYSPRVTRERVTADRLAGMVRQLADGQAGALVLQLVQAHELSADDIRQLRELLDQMEAEMEGRGD